MFVIFNLCFYLLTNIFSSELVYLFLARVLDFYLRALYFQFVFLILNSCFWFWTRAFNFQLANRNFQLVSDFSNSTLCLLFFLKSSKSPFPIILSFHLSVFENQCHLLACIACYKLSYLSILSPNHLQILQKYTTHVSFQI